MFVLENETIAIVSRGPSGPNASTDLPTGNVLPGYFTGLPMHFTNQSQKDLKKNTPNRSPKHTRWTIGG